jgi:hypothetical protein
VFSRHDEIGHEEAPSGMERAARATAVGLTVVLGAFALVEWVFVLSLAVGHSGTVGMDFALYQDRASSWLAGTGFYQPWQLSGPYQVAVGAALYPPTILLILLSARVLPLLWWIVPIGLTLVSVRRPSLWVWPLVMLALMWPRTITIYLYGNPAMWSVAFLAAGSRWGWPWALAALKPIAAPLALLGVRDPRWWAGATVGVAASVPFAVLWPDYVRVLLNARSGDPVYLFGDLPILLVPVLLWTQAILRNESSVTPPTPEPPSKMRLTRDAR